MNDEHANALFIRLCFQAEIHDPVIRYSPCSARKLVPYLIGYGVTTEQIARLNIYDAEEIRDAIRANTTKEKLTPKSKLRKWRQWCRGIGYNPTDVVDGAWNHQYTACETVLACQKWCKEIGSEPWTDMQVELPDRNASRSRPLRVEPAAILDACISVCRVHISEVRGPGRHPRVVLCRGLATAAMRTLTDISYPDIAAMLGKPNHSTTITAHRCFCAVWMCKHESYTEGRDEAYKTAWEKMFQALDLAPVDPKGFDKVKSNWPRKVVA